MDHSRSWHRNQAALMLASFVGFTGFTLVMPFLALQFQALGASDVGDVALWTGLTLGVTPLVAALCAPLWGRVGDRFGDKILIQRSLSSFVLVMVLMALATRPWHLFALRAVQGFVAGYGALAIAMAARSAPREKMAVAIGWVQTSQRLGPAFGPVAGGLLAPVLGLRGTFFVAAGAYGLAFALFTMLYRDPGVRRAPQQGPAAVAFSSVLAFENFLLLMSTIFVLQMVDRSLSPVLLLHISSLGFPPAAATRLVGLLFSVLAMSGALGHHLAAKALERLPAPTVLAGSTVAASVALALLASTGTAWMLMAAMALIGTSIGIATTTAFTAAGTVIPADAHGVSFGFLTGASLVGSATGSALAGLVAAQSIRVVFVAGVVLLAGQALVVRRAMAERRPIDGSPLADEF